MSDPRELAARIARLEIQYRDLRSIMDGHMEILEAATSTMEAMHESYGKRIDALTGVVASMTGGTKDA